MWNRLVTPPIYDREGMDRGDEGTSGNYENGWREWFSVADMTVDGEVVVGLLLCFMIFSVKIKKS